MADKPHFSPEAVAAALTQTRGIYAAAALVVGCERTTIERYVKKYATVAAAAAAARATLVDRAEGQLTRKIDAGEWPAIVFVLTTLGKDRGYAPPTRHELVGQDGGPPRFVLQIEVVDDRAAAA
jgi:hypothetical protein